MESSFMEEGQQNIFIDANFSYAGRKHDQDAKSATSTTRSFLWKAKRVIRRLRTRFTKIGRGRSNNQHLSSKYSGATLYSEGSNCTGTGPGSEKPGFSSARKFISAYKKVLRSDVECGSKLELIRTVVYFIVAAILISLTTYVGMMSCHAVHTAADGSTEIVSVPKIRKTTLISRLVTGDGGSGADPTSTDARRRIFGDNLGYFRCPFGALSFPLQRGRKLGENDSTQGPLAERDFLESEYICPAAARRGILSNLGHGCVLVTLANSGNNLYRVSGCGETQGICNTNIFLYAAVYAIMFLLATAIARPGARALYYSLVLSGFVLIVTASDPVYEHGPADIVRREMRSVIAKFIPMLAGAVALYELMCRAVTGKFGQLLAEIPLAKIQADSESAAISGSKLPELLAKLRKRLSDMLSRQASLVLSVSFFAGVILNVYEMHLPEIGLSPSTTYSAGSITLLVFLGIAALALVVWILRQKWRAGRLGHVLVFACTVIAAELAVVYGLGQRVHVHHYQIAAMGMLLLRGVHSSMAVVISGAALGVYIHGASRWGLAPMIAE